MIHLNNGNKFVLLLLLTPLNFFFTSPLVEKSRLQLVL